MTTERNLTESIKGKISFWAELTDDNLHSEALCDIAQYFDMPDRFINYFYELCSLESLTLNQVYKRNDMATSMLIEIRVKYGKEIADAIQRVL